MAKFKVLRFMTRRSEGMKPYEVGATIELTEVESKDLLAAGFVQKIATPKKAKK